MIVGGYSFPGVVTRPVSPAVTSQPAERVAPDAVPAGEEEDAKPTFFRSISSISYGSLAAAYQSMKAQEMGEGGTASRSSSEPAVLSAQGIPAAMRAYDEVLEYDAA